MSEQKFEIENSEDNLFMCFICQTKFDQYTLEVHYMETHDNDNDDVQNEILNKSEICGQSIETGKVRKNIKTVHKEHKAHKCSSC